MDEDKIKILVVDDQEANLFAMREVLKPLDGIEIITAKSGNEALSQNMRHRFALILLDVQMPGMDGIEAATMIRGGGDNPEVPIIFVTAINKDKKFVFKGYEAGAVDYLFKPVDSDILKSKVKIFIDLYRKKIDLEKKNNELESANNKNKLLLESAGEGILGINTQGEITFTNPKAEELLGDSEDNIVGKMFSDIEINEYETEWENSSIKRAFKQTAPLQVSDSKFLKISSGEAFPVDYTFGPLKDDAINGGVIVFRDITIRKSVEEQLIKLAKFDQLTDLANRSVFRDFLVKAMARAARKKVYSGVLFIDLDFFKEINDKHGHDAGDKLLISVADRLRECVRGNDLVARLGGDEFAIVLDMINSSNDAAMISEKIIKKLNQPHDLGVAEVVVSPSIGIAIYPGESDTPDEVIKCADSAMYRAKESGRNNYQLYDRKMYELAKERAHLENELRSAASLKDFLVYYQPQIDANTNEIIGLEALLRWPHSDFGMVSPQLFIPAAENLGVISEIGEWVLTTVVEQGKRWIESGITDIELTVALNVSAKQLQDGTFDKIVSNAIRRVNIDPSRIEIELTESTLMEDPEAAIKVLNNIHSMGVKVAVDDFGTGFSSLSYLNKLPIDTIKIDKNFVSDIGLDQKDEAIVRAIINLAHTLGMKVIAEGVETSEQVEFLKNNGCDILQGYYFSRPVDVDVATQLLSEGVDLDDPE